MNALSVTRKLTRIAAAVLTLAAAIERKVVGLHIRKLRDARNASTSSVIEASQQHDKFCADQHQRHMELEAQTDRAIEALETKKRRGAALNVAVALEITKLGHSI